MTDFILPIGIAIFASTGFWQFLGDYIKTKYGKKTVVERLLVGIAHDRIHFLCKSFIKQGYMTSEDYDTLQSIVEPYFEMGGNGSGKRLYDQAKELPIKND